ncbi:MAG: S1 RNA-binding domain-containing protein [Lachnospiraceae bacterium]|nr:S1 RNA-binding domain-containing protein [Lachnospiraceae bacterium]
MEAVEEKAEAAKEAVAEKAEELHVAAAEKTAEVTEAVAEKAEEIAEKAEEKAEEVAEKAAEKAEEVTEKAEEKVEAAAEKAEEAAAKAEEPAETMADYTAELEASYKKGPPKADDPTWDKFEQMLADKTVFEVKVDSVVKGGVVAFVDEVRAFIPASKLAAGYVENLDDYKGKNVEVIVITADREGKKLVLSGRDVARMKARAAKAAAQEAVQVDSVLEGTVDSLKDYGAFVTLEGGMSGLLHVSQISYKRVEKPADVLNVGDKIKVKVIGNKDGKISLSMKALEEAPAREKRERPERERRERSDRPEGERRERRERRDREESFNYTESGKATTSLGDLLSNIKLGE